MVWAGNVEIHLRASDWIKHNHHLDPSYNNVILHVVKEFDGDIWNSLGRNIPTMVLDFPNHLKSHYNSRWIDESWLPCNLYIRTLPSLRLQNWFKQLHIERVHQKTNRVYGILSQPDLDSEEAFYRALASGYGLPINTLPFEMLSSGIPLAILLDFRENLTVLEALLFGHSGFLHSGLLEIPYVTELWENYQKKAEAIPGTPVPWYLWKFFRLRPASFPTLRLSQFAQMIQKQFPIIIHLLESISLVEIEKMFKVSASEYWDTHYVFGKCSPSSVKYVGQQSVHNLIINVVVPFLYALGKTRQNAKAINRAKEILYELEAESNHIIKKWSKFGIKPCNAFESQALIQLHNEYCKQKRCLDCQIGAYFMEELIHEK